MAWYNREALSRHSCPWCRSRRLSAEVSRTAVSLVCWDCHMTHLVRAETVTPYWDRDEGAGRGTDPLA